MKTNPVLARRYVAGRCYELLALGRGRYIVSVNGQIRDARRKLQANEAREWWDAAAVQIGGRP